MSDELKKITGPSQIVWKTISALAGVVQWIEQQPANQRVLSWIPNQGTCLGCRPPVEGTLEATTHWCFSPSLSLSFPLSKNKKIKSFITKKEKRKAISYHQYSGPWWRSSDVKINWALEHYTTVKS